MKTLKKVAAAVLAASVLIGALPVFAAQDAELEQVIGAVKTVITVPQELSEFSYNKTDKTGETLWRLAWSDKDGENRISTTVTDDGRLYSYSYSKPYDRQTEEGLATISKEEGAEQAQAFLKKVTGDAYATIQPEDGALQYSGFAYTFYQTHAGNGIKITDNQLNVTVDKHNGEVVSYDGRFERDSSADYPAAEGAIDLAAAKEAYLKNIKLELGYQSTYDYASKTLTVFPAYQVKTLNQAVDARSGEIVDLASYAPYPMARNEMAMTADAAAGSSAKQSLTPEELAAVEGISGLLTKEQAAQKACDIVPELKGYTVNHARLTENTIDKGVYVWSLDFEKMEGEETVGYGSARVDAKTGELLSFSCYDDSIYRSSVPAKEKGQQPAYSKDAAKTAIETFIKRVAPEKFAKAKEKDVNSRYVSVKDEDDNTTYSVTYVRYENEIPFEDNYLRVTFNRETGKITSYGSAWYASAKFSDVSGAMSAEAAFDKAAETLEYQKMYRVLEPSSVKEEIRKLLVYDFNQATTALFDPFSGARLGYDGEAYKEEKAPVYVDIAEHWCKDAANKLLENGIYFARDAVKPDDSIVQADYLAFLYRAVNRYVPDNQKDLYRELENAGIVKEGEAAPDATVTRMDAVKFAIRALGYEKVAEIPNIYLYPFADSIDEAYKGYATLAYGLNIVKGDAENRFNPNNAITNAETVMIVYNMLSK